MTNPFTRLYKHIDDPRYELLGRFIVRREYFQNRGRIALPEIAAWACSDEMIFTIVDITTTDGKLVRWLDFRSDLVAILEEHAPMRQKRFDFP